MHKTGVPLRDNMIVKFYECCCTAFEELTELFSDHDPKEGKSPLQPEFAEKAAVLSR